MSPTTLDLPRARRPRPGAAVLREALRRHWPEYLMDGALLAGFMLSACLFGVLLEHPDSAVRAALPDPLPRRALMGLAMGATAVLLITSPFGRRSGAHMNPAVTLTFLRLGRIAPADAFFYVLAQLAGGLFGVALAGLLAAPALAHESVAWVATVPGEWGAGLAFLAEGLISGLLMLVVLTCVSRPALQFATPWFAGALLALYITFEAPFSGMSLNPARTLASAVPSGAWTAGWIYWLAPPAGMLLAAEGFRRAAGRARGHCAKLHHCLKKRCIFCGHEPECSP